MKENMPKQGEIDITYQQALREENKIELLEPFKGAKLHHMMNCLVCDHKWSATPLSKRQTYKKNGVGGCPNCNEVRKQNHYQQARGKVFNLLSSLNIEVLSDYDGTQTTTQLVRFRNIVCGHEFETHPGNVVQRQISCTVCGIKQRTKTVTAWSKANSEKWKESASDWQKYKSEVTALTEQTYKQYSAKINPYNYPRGRAGVEGMYHLDHIVPKRYCFDQGIPADVCAHHTNLQMIGWRENVGTRNHIKGTIPPLFFQHIAAGTKLEKYADLLVGIFPSASKFCTVGDVVTTVYDEQTNHAVIVTLTDKSHGNQKSALAASKALSAIGVRYTILFEDEMQDMQLLRAKLKHYTNEGVANRIHARQCDIRECTKEEKKALLNANHIQGNDNAPIAYGAYYEGQIVAVMTFTRPRVALGQKGNKDRTGVWELSRFCTDVAVRIPGIASRLLKTFQRNHEWKEIYSYADKRWSVGNMYHQLGFKLTADNPPDYYYVVDGVRKHRWNYRKDVLKHSLPHYDATATEYQNMEDHGYWRVWDCGTLKFTITQP